MSGALLGLDQMQCVSATSYSTRYLINMGCCQTAVHSSFLWCFYRSCSSQHLPLLLLPLLHFSASPPTATTHPSCNAQHLPLLLLPLLQFTAPPSSAATPPAVHSTSLCCSYPSCITQHLPLLLLFLLQFTAPSPASSNPPALHSTFPCCFYPSCSSEQDCLLCQVSMVQCSLLFLPREVTGSL